MDLKMLLLKSLSSEGVIRQHYRVHIGRNYYQIAYEVKGKYLTVKYIKRIDPLRAHKHRKKKRKRLLKSMLFRWQSSMATNSCTPSSLFSWSSTSTSSPSSIDNLVDGARFLSECGIQTLNILMVSVAVATELLPNLIAREQQTANDGQRKQSTQTITDNCTQQVQTESDFNNRAVQTEAESTVRQSVKATQTNIEYITGYHEEVQTDLTAIDAGVAQIEEQAVVFILNEIGEMIINQNHLLHNNSTLLSQISEMSLLRSAALKIQKRNYRYWNAFLPKRRRYFCRLGECKHRKRTSLSDYKSIQDAEQQTEPLNASESDVLSFTNSSTQTNCPKPFKRRGCCFNFSKT